MRVKNTKVGLKCVMKFYCTLCTCTLKYNFFTDRVREALNFILFDSRCGVSFIHFSHPTFPCLTRSSIIHALQ